MATLSYGTVNWELDTIQHYGLDKSSGIEMELVILANLPATRFWLCSMVVLMWRLLIGCGFPANVLKDATIVSFPYSSSVGGLMVNPKSNIKSVKDLEGKKVGVAGGALSKGWLLLQAAAPKYHLDLEKVNTTYGAPPLLNKELVSGRLDAVITYWHFSAALEAEGMDRLVELSDLQKDLGMVTNLPMIGYVFMEEWGRQNPKAVEGLAKASSAAKQKLQQEDASWERLRKKMKPNSEAHFQQLKKGFLNGIPEPVTVAHQEDAAKLFVKLGEYGGKDLTGESGTLMDGTFWQFD